MIAEPKPTLLIRHSDLQAAIGRLASEIDRDYRGKHPVIVSILKGSFMFTADIVRLLDFPVEIEFLRLSSYGDHCETSGRVKVVQGLCAPIKGRDVLVLEDIIDTGLTTAFFLDHLKKEAPASLKLCVLLDKPARRQVPVPIDYLGFTVPNKFIVGYGIDYDEKFRNLPDICTIEVC